MAEAVFPTPIPRSDTEVRPTSTHPNLAGYDDAMRRKRDRMGQDVIFYVMTTPTYAPDVPLDPESGKPIDPWAEPASGGVEVEVMVRGSVVNRPIGGGTADDSRATAIGIVPEDNLAVILSPEDFDRVKTARTFVAYGERFKVTDARPDGIGSLQRHIIFGTRT